MLTECRVGRVAMIEIMFRGLEALEPIRRVAIVFIAVVAPDIPALGFGHAFRMIFTAAAQTFLLDGTAAHLANCTRSHHSPKGEGMVVQSHSLVNPRPLPHSPVSSMSTRVNLCSGSEQSGQP